MIVYYQYDTPANPHLISHSPHVCGQRMYEQLIV